MNAAARSPRPALLANRGLFVDSTGRLWVADNGNNRVVSWASAATFTNGQPADIVLGQADFSGGLPNKGNAGPDATTLSGPRSVCVDSQRRVYVADSGNVRILRYDPPIVSGEAAVQVFGQNGSFTTSTQANGNTANANNLGNPDGVAIDSNDNLYLADRFLHRVVVYNSPATTDTTADLVIGQPNFNAAQRNQNDGNPVPAANTLNNPIGVGCDASGNLYVADEANNRVLLFTPPLSTNMSASRVFGQPDFTSNTAGTRSTTMNGPVYVAVDPVSGNLYVADAINHRILEFASPMTDSTADRVFGQLGDFTTAVINKGGISADSLNDVAGVATDALGNLYAGDRFNQRALRYNVAPAAMNPDMMGDEMMGPGGDEMTPGGDMTGGMSQVPCGMCGPGMGGLVPLLLAGFVLYRRRAG